MTKQEKEEAIKEKLEIAKKQNILSEHFIVGHIVDVLYGMYFNIEAGLGKLGLCLNGKEKQEFNRMMSSVKLSQQLLLKYTQGFIPKAEEVKENETDKERREREESEKAIDDFCDRSDDLGLVFKLFINKWFLSAENQNKIVETLLGLKGTKMFKQDVLQLEKQVGYKNE